jgi:glycogen debranching enzyme
MKNVQRLLRRQVVLGIFILVGLVFPGAFSSGSGIKDEARGVFFARKSYVDEPLPVFADSQKLLPSPVLEDNPELVELYWAAWKLAFKNMKKPNPGSGFVSNYLDEGFSPQIFQWDTIFMVMFARYGDRVFPGIRSLDNFYARQHANGFICREIKESNGEDSHKETESGAVNPPLFSWAEMENYRVTGDKPRLELVLPVLEKYAAWLEQARRSRGTVHGLYWNNGLGSGMDNTPRKGSGWVDMSSQMVIQYNNLSEISSVLGLEDKAADYRARAAEIGERINKWMWNEADGLYYDVDDNGKQLKWKTAACFWPMLAGITSPAQEEKLIANLKDPKSFWRLNVFPTLAADQKGYDPTGRYWRGGVWAPTNYAIIRGLSLRGHDDFAAEAVVRYLGQLSEVYRQTGTLWELYAPDRPSPGSSVLGDKTPFKARPDFVGWTGLGPIAMLIENIIGLRADAPNNRLVWHLGRTDRFGIDNFKFGDVIVSLSCERRESAKSPAKISVKSNKLFELVVIKQGAEKKFNVSPGEVKLLVE